MKDGAAKGGGVGAAVVHLVVPAQVPDSQVRQLPAGAVVGPGDHRAGPGPGQGLHPASPA